MDWREQVEVLRVVVVVVAVVVVEDVVVVVELGEVVCCWWVGGVSLGWIGRRREWGRGRKGKKGRGGREVGTDRRCQSD